MARLVDVSRWEFFDIVARDVAVGAAVAMSLRALVPAATIYSRPCGESSGDAVLTHRLCCRGRIPGEADPRAVIERAVETMEHVLDGRARIEFRETSTESLAASA